jgi:hypothetical protein
MKSGISAKSPSICFSQVKVIHNNFLDKNVFVKIWLSLKESLGFTDDSYLIKKYSFCDENGLTKSEKILKEFHDSEIPPELNESIKKIYNMNIETTMKVFLPFFNEDKPLYWFFAFEKIVPKLNNKSNILFEELIDKFIDLSDTVYNSFTMNYSMMPGMNLENKKRLEYSKQIIETLFSKIDEFKVLSIRDENINAIIKNRMNIATIWVKFKRNLFTKFNGISNKITNKLSEEIQKMAINSNLNQRLKFIKHNTEIDIPKIKSILEVLGMIPPNPQSPNIVFKFFDYHSIKTI